MVVEPHAATTRAVTSLGEQVSYSAEVIMT